MNTIKFTSPERAGGFYCCSEPGDNAGTYVPLADYERLRRALERISQPYDCGCKPCHCNDSIEAIRIDRDELKEVARAALKEG
jgi:hypothetical protein